MNRESYRLENELREKVFKVGHSIRGIVLSSQMPFSLLRLIFLKYAIDNYIGADDIESTKTFAEAQKAFALKDLKAGFTAIQSVLECIDRHYHLENILSSLENMENYSRDLFGTIPSAKSIRKSANEDSYTKVLEQLASIDLMEENKDEHDVGIMLSSILVRKIQLRSYRNSYAADYTTSESISKIAGAILDVQDGDIFCDFTSGIGLSTLAIAKDSKPKIVSIEVDRTAAALSAMLYILNGFENFVVYCDDSIKIPMPAAGGNKIFVDPPIKAEMYDEISAVRSDSSAMAVRRTIQNYLHGGTAVITIPGGFLFRNSKSSIEIKTELIREKCLRAVVSLPPLWGSTNIGTNLLVIRKPKNDNVVFIDASDKGVKSKESPFTVITENDIRLITDTINSPKSIDNFSSVIGFDRIEGEDYDLVPANYIKRVSSGNTESLEEIDAKLEELYDKLKAYLG